jgi:hypothetical protein
MTSADSTSAAELILHRPGHRAAGAARRIHVYLDDQQVADLELCGTSHVFTTSGPHLLRARCLPLIGASFPVILNAGERLRVLIYVGALDELKIQLDEQPDRSTPPT